MSSQIIRRAAGWAALFLSLAVWLWGAWPSGYARRSLVVRPPAVPETRRLELAWPAMLRLSDPGRITLTMQIDQKDIHAGQTPGESTQSSGYNLLVEADLEISGLQAVPAGEIAEPMQPGQSVSFYWSIRPDQAGIYPGMVWVHLRFVPAKGESSVGQKEEIRRVLTAQPVEIRTEQLMGLGGPQARALGISGIIVSSLVEIGPIAARLWKRIREEHRSANA